MRAALWTGDDWVVSPDVELRAPTDDEVVVEIEAAGLCHSDLNPLTGAYVQPTPAVLGHEAVGRVVDTGAAATDLLGRRVVMSPLASCGTCRRCRSGRPARCATPARPHQAPFSFRGEAVYQFVHIGAFAARTVVLARQVIPIPDEVPGPAAALLGCAVVTGTGAVARAEVEEGDWVLITGAGGIGLNAVQEARHRKAERVIVCDRDPRKEDLARRLGATDFVLTPTAADIRAAVEAMTPLGVDAAIECVGRPDILDTVIECLAIGGRAVVVGLPGQDDRLSANIRALFRERSILGCRMGSVDPQQAIPALAQRYLDGTLEIDALISHVVPLDDIASLVDEFRAGRLDRGVLLP